MSIYPGILLITILGKLYRACGNCATSHERHVQVDNVSEYVM